MIEFTGYLTANALKHYQRRSIRLTRVFLALLFSMCVSGLFYANFWFGKQISAITAISAIPSLSAASRLSGAAGSLSV